MPYVATNGLGFAESAPVGNGVNLFDPASYLAAFQSGGLLDTSQWDWHEYALAALAVYFVGSRILGKARAAKSSVSKKGKKVAGGFRKRGRALKTVFTG